MFSAILLFLLLLLLSLPLLSLLYDTRDCKGGTCTM